MIPFMTAFDRYLQTIQELQTRVIEGQRAKLIQVADKMAETTYGSINVKGAAEHNQSLLDKWRPRNIHL